MAMPFSQARPGMISPRSQSAAGGFQLKDAISPQAGIGGGLAANPLALNRGGDNGPAQGVSNAPQPNRGAMGVSNAPAAPQAEPQRYYKDLQTQMIAEIGRNTGLKGIDWMAAHDPNYIKQMGSYNWAWEPDRNRYHFGTANMMGEMSKEEMNYLHNQYGMTPVSMRNLGTGAWM